MMPPSVKQCDRVSNGVCRIDGLAKEALVGERKTAFVQ